MFGSANMDPRFRGDDGLRGDYALPAFRFPLPTPYSLLPTSYLPPLSNLQSMNCTARSVLLQSWMSELVP